MTLHNASTDTDPLYLPANPDDTPIFKFLARVNAKYKLSLATYHDLYTWSTTHIDLFWESVWEATNVVGQRAQHVVDLNAKPSDNPPWFLGSKLNWAENMLQERSATKLAVIQATEPTSEYPDIVLKECTYCQLYGLVRDLVSGLQKHGLKPRQCVASYASNCIENLAACLATTALGGIWVSAAADFGSEGVLERFEQVQPSFIFAVDAVVYNAKVHEHLSKLSSLLSGLERASDLKPKVIVIHSIPHPEDRSLWRADYIAWDSFIKEGQDCQLGRSPSGEIDWFRGSFNHPLWILFSSGTTGRPKAIVHRAGGMLLQVNKELGICGGLNKNDIFFYYTTTGWMMWPWQISGLVERCTLVLYDGSPLRDPSLLWNLVDQVGITIFGTSAKYLDQLSKGYKPREHHSLRTLRHIYSTGSPLAPHLFDYVYRNIHPQVLLGSITGGTDICSLFAGMCSALPVYRGEIQCRMLGMAMESYTDGRLAEPDEPGDLVCSKPFPCMPLGFWPLSGFGSDKAVEAASVRFQQAYFSQVKDLWYHGDHIMITRSKSNNGGGVIMLGRSDGVLNPGGIRFGSSEIYEVIDACFSGVALSERRIVDCVAVGQSIDRGTDERVVLFLKLSPGWELSSELEEQIKKEIRIRRSPRHVPAKIIKVADVPYTLNGKRVEVLVKKLINGAPLSSVNPATLSNPECLAEYVGIGEMLRGLEDV